MRQWFLRVGWWRCNKEWWRWFYCRLLRQTWFLLDHYSSRASWHFQWSCQRGFHQIILESDSLIAVRLNNQGCSSNHPCYLIVRQINLLARGREFVSFDRRFREANQSVDAFAKHGLSLYLDFNQVFDFIPHFVYLMLLVDTLCPFL